MKKLLATLILTTILLPSMLLVAGCGNAEEQAEATPSLLPIQVVKPLVATLDDYYDYVGSTQAVMDVAITARVKGYLEERHFEEGSMVQKGQLLYVIEKAEYELAIKEKEADLAKNRALAIDAKREKNAPRCCSRKTVSAKVNATKPLPTISLPKPR